MTRWIYFTVLLTFGVTHTHASNFQVIEKDGLIELDCIRPILKNPLNNTVDDNAEMSCLFNDDRTAIIHQDNKKGLIDKNGVLLTPIKYDDIAFHHELSSVQIGDKYGFVNTRTGKEITPVHFDEVGFLAENRINVKINDNWGYIDTEGNEITAFKYGNAYRFEHGLALVSNHGYVKDGTYRLGLIDKNGKEVFTPTYLGITVLENKVYFVDEAQLQGVSDLKNNVLIKPQYPILGIFNHGYALFSLFYRDFYGYLNEKGEEVISPQYLAARTPQMIDGKLLFVVAKQTDKGTYWGAVDKNNDIIIDFIYKDLKEPFNERVLIATNDDYKDILIDGDGMPLTAKAYDAIIGFNQGISEYTLSNKYGLIAHTGEEITPAIYDDISREYNHDNTIHYGFIIKQADKFGFLNTKGQEVLSATYDEVVLNSPLIYTKKDGLYGVADITGKIISPPKYEAIKTLNQGYGKVKEGQSWFLLDPQGKNLGKTSAPN